MFKSIKYKPVATIQKANQGLKTDPPVTTPPVDYTIKPAANYDFESALEAHKTGTDFTKNWMAHPVTRKKYRQNMNEYRGTDEQNLGVDNEKFRQALTSVQNIRPTFDKYYDDGERAKYTGRNNNVTYYGKPTTGTSTHEATHATKLDRDLSGHMMQKYGLIRAIRAKHGNVGYKEALQQEFNPSGDFAMEDRMKHTSYMGQNGELYPRIMEMRQFLNVVPGQEITDEMIQQIYADPKTGDTARYYKPEQLKEILNTVAYQGARPAQPRSFEAPIRTAQKGGKINDFITIIPGKTYTKTKGGTMSRKKPVTKSHKVIPPAPPVRPSRPKQEGEGGQLVNYKKGASMAKPAPSCGCGGKKFQQGGVMGQTGTDININEFNSAESGLFPNRERGKTKLEIPGTEKENNATTLTTMNTGAGVMDIKSFLKQLRNKRKGMGFDTSTPTSPITPDNMYNSGSSKQGGSSMKQDSTGQTFFQVGGPFGDGEDTDLAPGSLIAIDDYQGSIDGDVLSGKVRGEELDTDSRRIDDIIEKSETFSAQDGVSKPVEYIKGNSIMETIFDYVEPDKSFGKFFDFAGRAAQAESFRGTKEYNKDSSASGLFHILVGNMGKYDKKGNKVNGGGYNFDGQRGYSSFETSKNRMKNLLRDEDNSKLLMSPHINKFVQEIDKASDPDQLTREQQLFLFWVNMKMKGGEDYKKFFSNPNDDGETLYRNHWVTLSGDHSESDIGTNWLNAGIREEDQGYGYGAESNRKFFDLKDVDYDYGSALEKAYDEMGITDLIENMNTKKSNVGLYHKGGKLINTEGVDMLAKIRERNKLI